MLSCYKSAECKPDTEAVRRTAGHRFTDVRQDFFIETSVRINGEIFMGWALEALQALESVGVVIPLTILYLKRIC